MKDNVLKIKTRYDPTPWIAPKQETIKLLTTGDWHTLDKWGICPPNFKTKEGTPLTQHPVQEIVYNECVEICKNIGHVNIAILMGDMAEGKQAKSFGVPLMDADTDNQVNAAFQFYEETIHKYCTPDIVLAVMGTPYHRAVGIGGDLDYQVALRISNIDDVIFGQPNLNFLLGKDKVRWNLQHRISIARVNRMVPFEKTFRLYARQEAESWMGSFDRIPDIIVRAHRHDPQLPFGIGQGRRWAMTTPPLKVVDEYASIMAYPVGPCSVGLMTVTQHGLGDFKGKYYPIKVESDKVEVIR